MASNGNTDNALVAKLVQAGRYHDAAVAARECGAFTQATDLFERIWEFEDAAKAAEAAGDLPRALSNAIEARSEELVDDYESKLEAQGESGRQKALDILAKHGRFARAARLAEALEDRETAVQYYQRAHKDADAARVLISLGRQVEAGRLLERVVRTSDNPLERCHAHLALGRILSQRFQHEDAARHFQNAANARELGDLACSNAALKALIVELAKIQLLDAARDVLLRLRSQDPSVPPDLDGFLHEHRAEPQKERPRNASPKLIGGRYRLGQRLGVGASGRVYAATDEVTKRRVAIKLLTNSQGESYERFVRETRIAAGLSHPNLVKVYDFSADHGFLVMELMEGGSLATKVSGKIPQASVRRMVLDVLDGLKLAHQRGIIHRDIKPANIFFDAGGTAKLGDFGVAHLLDLGQTQTGGLIGTLAYMSPEQITGAPLTIAADLYALGVTTFEALTGRLPFVGPDFVAQHLGETPPHPSDVANVSPLWDSIIDQLLKKTPSERPGSIDEVKKQLRALQLKSVPKPLKLPRAPKSSTEPRPSAPSPSEHKPDKQPDVRYSFETALGETPSSSLSRAIDTTLDRSVIIERFTTPLTPTAEQQLFAFAKGGGPFLQRVLSYDKANGVAIFEAPAGACLRDLPTPLSPRLGARLLMRLARAVAPLHKNGSCHGQLRDNTIVLDTRGNPTVLVSGLRPPTGTRSPANDVQSLLQLIPGCVGASSPAAPSSSLTVFVIHAILGPAAVEALVHELAQMPLANGEDLYLFASRVERHWLAAKYARAG